MRIIALLVSLLLIIAGAAGAAVEWLKQPAYLLTTQLNRGIPVNTADLLAEIEAHKSLENMGWQDAHMLKMTAQTEYSLARSAAPYSKERTGWTAAAEAHLSKGLSLAPADATGWLRLARIRMLTQKSDVEIAQALLMSLHTGPAVSQLIVPRLKLAIIYQGGLQPQERALFDGQLAILQEWKPEEALELMPLGRPSPFMP